MSCTPTSCSQARLTSPFRCWRGKFTWPMFWNWKSVWWWQCRICNETPLPSDFLSPTPQFQQLFHHQKAVFVTKISYMYHERYWTHFICQVSSKFAARPSGLARSQVRWSNHVQLEVWSNGKERLCDEASSTVLSFCDGFGAMSKARPPSIKLRNFVSCSLVVAGCTSLSRWWLYQFIPRWAL